MGKQTRRTEFLNSSKAYIAKSAVLGSLALFPSVALAQSPAEQPSFKSATSLPTAEAIGLCTSKQKVDLLLGPPRIGSTITCLHRAHYTYADGTSVIFMDGVVVSVTPNGLALGNPAQGFVVEREGKQIFIEPVVLCGFNLPGPIGDKRREIQESFIYGPAFHDVSEPIPPSCLPFLPGPYPPNCQPVKRVFVY